jgi:phage terminase large subunit
MTSQLTLSDKQIDALDVLDDPLVQVVLYGGAKGGGKSYFGCWWMYLKCLQFIKDYNLMPTKNPIPVGFMGRKQSVDFTDTTLETWKAAIPEETYSIRYGDKEIIIQDALKIQYGGFDSAEQIKKFNSAEYAIGFVDQAEEISRDDFGLFRGTLRRKIGDNHPSYKILLTANPAPCWLKDEFILSLGKGCAFVQALPSDNPFLPEGYLETLKESFKHRPELYEAYVNGSWDVIAGENIVIKPSWIEKSINRELAVRKERRVVACDPARYGNDETVIYVLEDGKIIDQMIYGEKSTMETAGYCIALKNKHQAKIIAVDSIGIGAGIVDRLRELREPVKDINSSQKPELEKDQKIYINIRSQMWWEAADKFYHEETSLPSDPILKRQLMNITYAMTSRGAIQVESKEDIKSRMSGQSPDRADAYIMGLYALKYATIKARDFQRTLEPTVKDAYGWNEGRGEHNAY